MAFQKRALPVPAFASDTWAPLCSEVVLRERKCLCKETCRWVGWGHKWNICFHYPKTNLVPIKSVRVRRSEDGNWQSKLQPHLIPPPSQCHPLQPGCLHTQAEQGTHTLSDGTHWPCWLFSNACDIKCHCPMWFTNTHSFTLHTSLMKHREVTWLNQGHTAGEWQIQDLNPGSQPQCHAGYWSKILCCRHVLRPRSQLMGISNPYLNKLKSPSVVAEYPSFLVTFCRVTLD